MSDHEYSLELADARIQELEAINNELVWALEDALSTYEEITTGEFARGKDKLTRARMHAALTKARGE